MTVLVSSAWLAPGDTTGSAGASSTTRQAAAAAPLPVSFAAGLSSWKPSSNARVRVSGAGRDRSVTLTPRAASRRTNVSMISRTSTTVVPSAGTAVAASARLRTSQPRRRLTLRILEIEDGRTVSSRSTTVRPSSRGWRTVSVRLRTTRPNARIRLYVHAKRLPAKRLVRLASAAVTASATPIEGPVPVVTRSCQDTDYSDPAQGVRTFTDDFAGTELDRTTWRVRDSTFLNQDKAWITKDAVTVHDGVLDIAGKRLPPEQHRVNVNALYPANRIRDYSTGYVDTIDSAGYGNAAANRFGQKYGHFEIRAWVPSEATMSRGIWPAFWLRADHRSGEIDPMESYGAPSIRSVDPSSSYEWNSWADTAQGSSNEPNKQMTHGHADVGDDLIWQGWHTYGVNWSPSCLRYLYDGRTVGLVDFDDPATKPYFRGPTFDDTFHIRLNMQVGSNYWGWPDSDHTRPDFSFKIDWVRVHQRKDLVGR